MNPSWNSRDLIPLDLLLPISVAAVYGVFFALLPTWVNVVGVLLLLWWMCVRSYIQKAFYMMFLFLGVSCLVILALKPEFQESWGSTLGWVAAILVCVEGVWVWQTEFDDVEDFVPTNWRQRLVVSTLGLVPRLSVIAFLTEIIAVHYHLFGT